MQTLWDPFFIASHFAHETPKLSIKQGVGLWLVKQSHKFSFKVTPLLKTAQKTGRDNVEKRKLLCEFNWRNVLYDLYSIVNPFFGAWFWIQKTSRHNYRRTFSKCQCILQICWDIFVEIMNELNDIRYVLLSDRKTFENFKIKFAFQGHNILRLFTLAQGRGSMQSSWDISSIESLCAKF